MNLLDSVKGKVAIVTGAGRGLGRAYAHALGAAGASVAVADIDIRTARTVAEELTGVGGFAVPIEVDVADEAATNESVRRVLGEFGRIDILINNAGIYPLRAWTEITTDDWDRVQAVNVKGSFLCARAVFPAMKRQGKGKIINIASSVVFNPLRNVHYVASKAAVVGLTRALARELGPWNIAVNAVSPGLIQIEDALGVQSEEMVNRILSAQCFNRLGLPEDLIGPILFLSSDLSDFITGQVLVVDGGWTMH